MQTRLKNLLLTLLITLLLPLGLSMPVHARNGADDSTSGSSNDTTTTTTTTTADASETNNKTTSDDSSSKPEQETEKSNETTTEVEVENHKRGSDIVTEAKKTEKKHTKDERIKNCTNNQHGLDTKFANLQKNAKKHLLVMDSVFTKIQDFQKTTTVTIPNIDSLITSATAAQTKATASVSALTNLSSTIDCSTDTAAMDIGVFKAAADQAKTDLKAYRTSLKAILSAIETATEGEQ